MLSTLINFESFLKLPQLVYLRREHPHTPKHSIPKLNDHLPNADGRLVAQVVLVPKLINVCI